MSGLGCWLFTTFRYWPVTSLTNDRCSLFFRPWNSCNICWTDKKLSKRPFEVNHRSCLKCFNGNPWRLAVYILIYRCFDRVAASGVFLFFLSRLQGYSQSLSEVSACNFCAYSISVFIGQRRFFSFAWYATSHVHTDWCMDSQMSAELARRGRGILYMRALHLYI